MFYWMFFFMFYQSLMKFQIDINSIDEAMKNGFGWQLGPFEIIDKIGISFLKEKAKEF